MTEKCIVQNCIQLRFLVMFLVKCISISCLNSVKIAVRISKGNGEFLESQANKKNEIGRNQISSTGYYSQCLAGRADQLILTQ